MQPVKFSPSYPLSPGPEFENGPAEWLSQIYFSFTLINKSVVVMYKYF